MRLVQYLERDGTRRIGSVSTQNGSCEWFPASPPCVISFLRNTGAECQASFELRPARALTSSAFRNKQRVAPRPTSCAQQSFIRCAENDLNGSSMLVAAKVSYRAAKWAHEGRLRVMGVNSAGSNELPQRVILSGSTSEGN
jgi:hypothetical protein